MLNDLALLEEAQSFSKMSAETSGRESADAVDEGKARREASRRQQLRRFRYFQSSSYGDTEMLDHVVVGWVLSRKPLTEDSMYWQSCVREPSSRKRSNSL